MPVSVGKEVPREGEPEPGDPQTWAQTLAHPLALRTQRSFSPLDP